MTDNLIKKPVRGELIAAIERNDIGAVENLLDRGADANEANDRGDTALLLALKKTKAYIILLVERGADPHKENNQGYSPVDSITDALNACYEFGMPNMVYYQDIEKILREAPERHRRFIEKKSREAAAKAEAAARAEQARHERASGAQEKLKGKVLKLKPKSGPGP